MNELLDLVRLSRESAERFPDTLSGGQRQRVGVARAIAARPRIVLMDEPFGAVDPITREALADDYRTLHGALQLTTVMITHDLLEAVLLADRIAVMQDGRIVDEGTPHELLTASKHDYVRDLMAKPRRQADRVAALAAGGGEMSGWFDPNVTDAFARLPDYLGQHVMLSVSAIVLGLLFGLPLAVAGLRSPRFRVILLGVIGLAQTIPGLALLALFYPLLLGLSLLTTAAFGLQFSALGFLPSLLALTLYSMLPILRNTITGVLGVDASIKQAAIGVGMTPMQSLLQVELPLALPTIMAGVRTAAVWVIGTATLSTAVGQTSLGNYIFTGLQTQNWIFVLFGCVAAAVLALLVDALLASIESSLTSRNRRGLALAAAATVLVLAASSLPAFAEQRPRAIRHRRQALCRAVCARRPAAAAPERRGPRVEPARRPRLHRRLRCARRRRHRPLCRLHRHDLDQRDAPERVHLARSRAGRDRHLARRPITA